MRTYDPAEGIRYVHLAQDRAARPAPPPSQHAQDECHRLPVDYPNVVLRARLGAPRATGPALVLLPGGSAAGDDPAPAAPALRLAQ